MSTTAATEVQPWPKKDPSLKVPYFGVGASVRYRLPITPRFAKARESGGGEVPATILHTFVNSFGTVRYKVSFSFKSSSGSNLRRHIYTDCRYIEPMSWNQLKKMQNVPKGLSPEDANLELVRSYGSWL